MTVLCYLYKKSPDFKLMLIYNNLQLYITTCIIYNLQVVYFIIKSVYIGNQIGHVFKMSAPIRPYSRIIDSAHSRFSNVLNNPCAKSILTQYFFILTLKQCTNFVFFIINNN